MDSLFNAEDNNSIQERINKLTPDAKPLWGKMNVSQMLAHLQPTMLVSLGELQLKGGLMAILFGKIAKKRIVTEQPFKQNIPTLKAFKVAPKDFETEKNTLLSYVNRFKTEGTKVITTKPHPFFGPLKIEEWDMLQWKHLDHHLRQFGV
jgi:hypothetical protein